MNKCVQIGIKKFDVFVAEGVAKGSENRSDQSYYVGYSVLGGGNVLNSAVSKSTNFFLIGDNGNENYVAIEATLPMRDGHRVRVLHCGEPKSGSGVPIAVLNENTGKTAITPAADFQSRFKVIGQASWLVKVILGFLITCWGVATWVMDRGTNSVSPPVANLAGWCAVVGLVYIMYEGLIGIRFWSAIRIRELDLELSAIAAGEFKATP
jgi:hypothetical protein